MLSAYLVEIKASNYTNEIMMAWAWRLLLHLPQEIKQWKVHDTKLGFGVWIAIHFVVS